MDTSAWGSIYSRKLSKALNLLLVSFVQEDVAEAFSIYSAHCPSPDRCYSHWPNNQAAAFLKKD